VTVYLEAVQTILSMIDNPQREGLEETPRRYLTALQELTAGNRMDPAEMLSKVFTDDYDEMIIVKDIPFTSLCEHHLLPFIGHAHLGYLPEPSVGVVGLSKLARLVECFARRLQLQERMTRQIATSIEDHLKARGVGVVVEAEHQCMACRGVRKEGTKTITSIMLGRLRDANPRAEFLSLVKP